MESQNIILISSLIINVLMIVERCLNRVRKSTCFGSNIELSDVKNTDNKNDNVIDMKQIFELINNNNKKQDDIKKDIVLDKL